MLINNLRLHSRWVSELHTPPVVHIMFLESMTDIYFSLQVNEHIFPIRLSQFSARWPFSIVAGHNFAMNNIYFWKFLLSCFATWYNIKFSKYHSKLSQAKMHLKNILYSRLSLFLVNFDYQSVLTNVSWCNKISYIARITSCVYIKYQCEGSTSHQMYTSICQML